MLLFLGVVIRIVVLILVYHIANESNEVCRPKGLGSSSKSIHEIGRISSSYALSYVGSHRVCCARYICRGGILLPMVMTLLYQTFSPEERGTATSVMGVP